MNLKTIIIRTLSGAVYVVLIVCAILLNEFVFAAVFGTLCTLTVYEFHKVTNRLENVEVFAWAGIACSLLIFVLTFLLIIGSSLLITALLILVPLLFIIFITEIFRKQSNPINNIAYIFLGQIYIVFPFCIMILMQAEYSRMLLAVFIIIWINDTFAYLIGSWLGKHRLFERISPKKSWEGFFGGLIGALTAVFVLFQLLPENIYGGFTLNLWQWLGFALIIVIFGTIGDLFESLIKRTVGIKDSGKVIPGHGGLLDRFDSILLAIPAVLLYLFLIGRCM